MIRYQSTQQGYDTYDAAVCSLDVWMRISAPNKSKTTQHFTSCQSAAAHPAPIVEIETRLDSFSTISSIPLIALRRAVVPLARSCVHSPSMSSMDDMMIFHTQTAAAAANQYMNNRTLGFASRRPVNPSYLCRGGRPCSCVSAPEGYASLTPLRIHAPPLGRGSVRCSHLSPPARSNTHNSPRFSFSYSRISLSLSLKCCARGSVYRDVL